MEIASLIFVILFVVVGGAIRSAYGSWIVKNIATRVVVTSLEPDQLRDIFVRRVAGNTWHIEDDGNPMVAQSSLVMGIRQQIGLGLSTAPDGRAVATVSVMRWTTKRGIPNKAHTLRMRLNSFVNEVQQRDSHCAVVTRPLGE